MSNQAKALQNDVQLLSFPRSTNTVEPQDVIMKGLNHTITAVGSNKYRIDVRIMAGGRQYRKRKTVEGKKNAQKLAMEIIQDIQNEVNHGGVSRSLTLFSECIDFYKKHSPRNIESTKFHLKKVEEELGHVPVDEIQHYYTLFIERMKKSFTKYGKFYSNATLNRYTIKVSAVLNFCKSKGVISDIHFTPTKFREEPRDRPILPSEIEAIKMAMKEYRPYLLPIFEYAIQVPSRKSELTGMLTEWVDVERQIIAIPRGITKTKEPCIKPIPPNMLSYFKAIPEGSKYVFYRVEGDEYKGLGDFKKAWAYCKEKAGVTNLRWHDTRHYAISNLLEKNVPAVLVAEVANWKSTNMIDVYYNKNGYKAASTVAQVL